MSNHTEPPPEMKSLLSYSSPPSLGTTIAIESPKMKAKSVTTPSSPTSGTPSTLSPTSSSSTAETSTSTTPVTKRRGGLAPAPILPVPVRVADNEDDDYDDYDDDDEYSDMDGDDEDDEIMAAQRAEFAALWGISLTDMVDQKEDREFFKLMSKIQV